MSALLDRADDLAAYLATVDGLQPLTWLVDRQKNLGSEFTKATAKKLGLGVIAFLGGSNRDRQLSAVRLAARYSVSLFFKPVIHGGVPRDGSKEPAELAELVARALHHWFPDETPTKSQVRFEVTDMTIADAEEFHVIRIDAESVVQFSSEAVSFIEP
ncbi:hypothetical protein OKA05_27255 [Luteolibacter arcticus]|uniref:Uncharacterized protein n=1 Tax=Luteolibacter arcticus TaxID=1581411 RepID=A0ABT3GS02_9BACT|nr:hypothetical protein [Luteolibacter arcticus]MCW1926282.1 hypothetical protein [Luteolibacter arcticus]